jgi:CRISPR-associated endonuclease/helicase Cas3
VTLTAADFPAFFHAVHCVRPAHGAGCIEPFSWQQRLVAKVLDGDWPDVIDVPTGLGKTAVIDVAVFALAAQAEWEPADRIAPTRTFVVVNRRLIVDQTHERARLLQRRLLESLTDPRGEVLADVARRLRGLSVGAGHPTPLAVVRMRGGVTWSWRWLASPAQPAIVTGTVDQFGSRLLFRGYGVGDTLRPIDAALAGADRLLILDEAHLAWPFVRTIAAIDASERRARVGVLPLRRPPPVLLSATPPLGQHQPRDVFRLDAAAETSEVAQRRLTTSRELRLVDLRSGKQATDADLGSTLAVVAERLLGGVGRRLAVVCNTVALARHVFGLLEERLADRADVALLIGRCREIDRWRIAEQWLAGRLAPDERPVGARPLVAVATQTIEVGADIDFDALVTEAAPIDALLQRLGRLDRRGSQGSAQAVVVHAAHRHDGADATVYGDATRRTWEWLVERAGQPESARLAKVASALEEAPSLDLGPSALSALLDASTRSTLASEPPLAPVALSPTLAAWARTHPRPQPDQEVGPFLHGLDHGRPEVLACWRAGLPSPDSETLAVWESELDAAPVGSHETLSLPLAEVRRFLHGEAVAGGADVEGRPGDEDGPARRFLPAVAQGPDGRIRLLARSGRLAPGDVVVLRAEVGGHDDWGWTGEWSGGASDERTPVADVADLDDVRPRLRLRSAALRSLGLETDVLNLPGADDLEADLDKRLRAVRSAAEAASESAGKPSSRWYTQRLATIWRNDDARLRWTAVRSGSGGTGARERTMTGNDRDDGWWVVSAHVALPAVLGDGDGDVGAAGASSVSGQRVDLDSHLWDVEGRARLVGECLGLPQPLVRALGLAALAHDLGKADPRFQAMLYGGSRDRAEATGRLLAKSGMDPSDRDAYREAAARSGLPAGMRHEALSASLLATALAASPEMADGLDPDLVLHLVVTHHGFGRPLLPGVSDSEPEPVTARMPGMREAVTVSSDSGLIDWEAPSRYKRLGTHYGWWGLALVEAVLRLADIAVSEEYGQQGSRLREGAT